MATRKAAIRTSKKIACMKRWSSVSQIPMPYHQQPNAIFSEAKKWLQPTSMEVASLTWNSERHCIFPHLHVLWWLWSKSIYSSRPWVQERRISHPSPWQNQVCGSSHIPKLQTSWSQGWTLQLYKASHTSIHPRITHPHYEPNESTSPVGKWRSVPGRQYSANLVTR